MEIQDYTDSAFKHALARNVRSLTRGKKSSKQPIAIEGVPRWLIPYLRNQLQWQSKLYLPYYIWSG